jgi:adenine-specific DNA-methyltransferase
MIENQDIQQVDGKTPQFRTELARQLEDLVPEAIADGKVDVAKLKELLQEDAGDTNERFGLFWPGKKRAMRAAQDPTSATLRPAPELSKDWDTTDNVFIEGDNLEVLKVLQRQYHNKIKMIYIDPPYNTGKDFVYPDNFKEGLQNYLEFSKQVDAGNKRISTNTETVGRYHSNWLNMMYPRLKLARNLLTDDGVIFISIDDAEQSNLKKMCDEVFGESNFIAQVIWKKKVFDNNEYLPPLHDYQLVYARNKANVELNLLPRNEQQLAQYKYDDNDGRGSYKFEKLTAPTSGGRYSQATDFIITNPVSGQEYRSNTGNWRFGKATIEGMIAVDDINFDGSLPRYKLFLNKVKDGVSANTFWDDVDKNLNAAKQILDLFKFKAFETPKPIGLIVKMLKIASDKDSLVLDFFSGSGTAAHAVMQLNAEDGGNRKHIQVQLPEPTDEKSEAYKAGYKKISDIARERINRAGARIKTDFADKLTERDTPLDVGYRTYQLSDTNFRKWQGSATADLGEVQRRLDLMRDSANDNASEADLLVEVMLKMGLPLTTRTTEQSVSGLTIHQVVHATNDDDTDTSEGAPVFYLNEHAKPTLEQLRAVVTELTPSKLVILEDAFQGDNELKTNLTQTCKSYDVELWTV